MSSKKYAHDAKRKVYRPAIERGIPAKVVDAILAANPIDEEEITRDALLSDDLGMDSLDVVELAMNLEEAYGFPISDRVLDSWQRVSDVITTVEKAA